MKTFILTLCKTSRAHIHVNGSSECVTKWKNKLQIGYMNCLKMLKSDIF